MLDADVPDGTDESANKEVKRWGTPPAFDFAPKQHFELGEALGMMDFAAAAKIAGARFTVLRGPLARLERALGQFMIDLHTTRARLHRVRRPLAGQRRRGLRHQPAAEIRRGPVPHHRRPLADPHRRSAADQPGRRRNPRRKSAAAGASPRSPTAFAARPAPRAATPRGMLRQHQFRKVELVSIAHPDTSDAEHERMTRCAEQVLERLELPYRRMTLCSGDTGFGAAKTFDLEVWLPGQGAYGGRSARAATRGRSRPAA